MKKKFYVYAYSYYNAKTKNLKHTTDVFATEKEAYEQINKIDEFYENNESVMSVEHLGHQITVELKDGSRCRASFQESWVE